MAGLKQRQKYKWLSSVKKEDSPAIRPKNLRE